MTLLRVSGLLLGFTLVSSTLGQGCQCEGPVVPDAGVDAATLAFAGLPATIDCTTTSDAAPATAGFQIEVAVQLANGEGNGFTTVSVASSQANIAAGEGTFDAEGRALVVVTVVTEGGLGAENTLTATAKDESDEAITASESVRVICESEIPAPVCRFTAPDPLVPLTASPVSVTVQCSGGDPDSPEEQSLLSTGTVVVTATPSNDEDPESVEIDLVAGTGTGDLVLPRDDTAVLSLVLVDAAGVFDAAVTDSIEITIERGSALRATDIVALAAGADNILNIADNGGAATAGDVTTDVVVTFDQVATGGIFTGSTSLGSCTGTANGTAVTLADCVFAQGRTVLTVTGADLSGTPMSSVGASLTLTVDTVAPTAVFAAPLNGDVLTSADDSDAAVGLQLLVNLVSTDEGAPVSVFDGGQLAGSGTVQASSALIEATIGQGVRTLTAELTDAAGNTGTVPAITVTVDSEGPVLVLVAPGAINNDDDLDPNTLGISIDVRVTPSGLTSGRAITIATDLDDVINQGPCVSAGDAAAVTCRVTFVTDGVHTVIASALDELGNLGLSNPVAVDADTGLITVTIDNPPLRGGLRSIGAAEDTAPGGDADVLVTGTTGLPAVSVILLINGIIRGAPVVSGANGSYVLPVTLSDGETGSLEVRTNGGTPGTSGIDNFRVDLGRPTTLFSNPATDSATFARAQDISVVAGLQANITVDVTECEDGIVQILDGATVIGTNADVPASGTASLVVEVSDLTGGDNETWTAVCRDIEGNTPVTPDTLTVTVDIIAPETPVLTVVIDNLRRGFIDVRYTQPGDDGNVGNATTIVAFLGKTVPVSDVNFGAEGQVRLVVPSGATAGGTAVGPNAVGTRLTPLAFDHIWHIGLRAVDNLGNASAMATATVDLTLSEVVLSAPAGVTGWAQSFAKSRGDLNGDGFDDTVVGAPGQFSGGPGGFEVILGGATEAALSRTFVSPPATLACAAPPCTPLEAGWAVNIISSINGDAFDDVVVVSYDQRFNPEFLLIYAGTATGIAAGATPVSVLEYDGNFSFAGFGAQSVGDVDGDGDIDWVIPARNEGAVYLFLNSGGFPASGSMQARATTRIFHSGFPTPVFGQAVTHIDGSLDSDLVISSTFPGELYAVRSRAIWPASLNVSVGGNNVDVIDLVVDDNNSPGFELTNGDFDGDGDLDVLLASSANIHTLVNTNGDLAGEQDWGAAVAFELGVLGSGDLTGDGRDDFFGGGQSPLRVFFGVDPLVAHGDDIEYAGVTAPLLFVAGRAIIDASIDLVYVDTTAPGRVTIRH